MKTLYLTRSRLKKIKNEIEIRLALIEFDLESAKVRKEKNIYNLSPDKATSLIDDYYYLSIQREIAEDFLKQMQNDEFNKKNKKDFR